VVMSTGRDRNIRKKPVLTGVAFLPRASAAGGEPEDNRYVPVDGLAGLCYNMLMMKTRRTPRKDSSYIIYEAVDQRGHNYIGLTRKTQSTVGRSISERWRRHLSRARNENRLWALYVYLKTGGLEHRWEHRVLEIVRGRAEAYAREREIVKAVKPTLNDQYVR